MLISIFASIGASAEAKSWDFTRFDAEIFVQSNGSFIVRETQTVNFDGDFHYFYRSIAMRKLSAIRNIKVTDLAGNPVDAQVYNEDGKKVIRLDFDITDETKTWIFEYTVYGGLGYFAGHDELYWNAISSEREAPIKSSTIRVVLPAETTMIDMKAKMFYGLPGSKTTLSGHHILDARTFEFEAKNIESNTDLTIVAGWPKGVIDEPFIKSSLWKIISICLGVVVFLIIFLTVLVLFMRYGRDPHGRGTIIPQYEPPDEIGPLPLAMLVREHVSNRDISAAVIDLARRGYVKIIEERKKKILKDKVEFTIKRIKEPKDLNKIEQLLMEGLFEGKEEIELSMLEDRFYKCVPDIKKAVFAEVHKLGYYSRNPLTIRLSYLAVGVLLLGLAIAGIALSPDFKYLFGGFAGGGGVLTGFANFMSRRTPQGVFAYEHALGFKDYLHTAERFRIAASTPETFEKFLPHAMVLHVEKEWAERFADIYKQQPDWYVSSGGAFNAAALTDSLSSVQGSMSSTFSSSPSSSSGFGGGGSAGGGGGGGGSGAG